MKKIYFRSSVCRNKKFQIKTSIIEDNGEKYVVKEAVYPSGIQHIKNTYNNEKLIRKIYADENVTYGTIKDGAYITKFHNGKTLSELMYKCLLNGQIEKYKEHQKIWKNLITGENNLIGFHYTEKFKEIFGVNDSDLLALPSTKISNIDCSSDNIIYDDKGQIKVIDYEWVYDFPVPVDFIFYRVLHLFYSSYSVPYSWQELLEMSGIDVKYVNIYDKMIGNFNDYVGLDREKNINYLKLGSVFLTPVFTKKSIDDDIKYVFDTKKIPEGSRVIIYGAGNVGRSFSTFIERTVCYELIAVCDKKAELLRKQGVKVIDKSELPKYEFDYIIVAVLRKNVADSIKEELSFIDSDKILWLKPVLK